jgi:hypothetical protein
VIPDVLRVKEGPIALGGTGVAALLAALGRARF